MDKTINQKAWFLGGLVFLVVAFSAVLPLMTVVNYSMQDTFGNNQFFWNGVGWFKELLDPSTDLGGPLLAPPRGDLFFSAGGPFTQGAARTVDRSRRPLPGLPRAQSVLLGGDPCNRGAARHRDCPVDAARGLAGRGLPRHPRAAAPHSMERGRHHLADLRTSRYRPARLYLEQPWLRLQ